MVRKIKSSLLLPFLSTIFYITKLYMPQKNTKIPWNHLIQTPLNANTKHRATTTNVLSTSNATKRYQTNSRKRKRVESLDPTTTPIRTGKEEKDIIRKSRINSLLRRQQHPRQTPSLLKRQQFPKLVNYLNTWKTPTTVQ